VSVDTMASLAVARNATSKTQTLKRREVRRVNKGKNDDAKWRDIVLALVPTEIVAPYTAVITLVAGAVDDPTKRVPQPNDYAPLRWVVFVLFLALAIWAILRSYYDADMPAGSPPKEFPLAVFLGGMGATIVWELTIPESPLITMLSGKAKLGVPAGILIVAAAVISIAFPTLKKGVQ
jgi:hypothetical protein